jgi:hypothetical protein
LDVNLPLRDAEVQPQSELYYRITMKDDAGGVVGVQSGVLSTTSNRVEISNVVPGKVVGDRPVSAGRAHFLVGEMPVLWIGYGYCITSPNVNNWQIMFGPLEALDSKGAILYSYQPTQPHVLNLETGYGGGPARAIVLSGLTGPPLPTGTRMVRLRARLLDPSRGAVMAAGRPYQVEVREASQTAELDIPAGASQVAFSPIPVRLKFTSNETAGRATAEEFQGQFTSARAVRALAKPVDFSWGLIPLTRYWAVYDTLKRGTFAATVTFTYDPALDFPAASEFNEDSLVVAGLNPMSGDLEPLASTLDKPSHTLTTEYTKLFDTYVISSRTTLITAVQPPHAGTGLPQDYRLEQNYPNPFNPKTGVRFQVPALSEVEGSGVREAGIRGQGPGVRVKLTVYDLLGREVAVLVNEKRAAGSYEVSFDGSGLASGVYIYRLTAGTFIQSRKMVLIK